MHPWFSNTDTWAHRWSAQAVGSRWRLGLLLAALLFTAGLSGYWMRQGETTSAMAMLWLMFVVQCAALLALRSLYRRLQQLRALPDTSG